MINYEGTVYRPPSEAYSLIIQVTIGCAHNKCSFCSMYKDKKFKIKNLKQIYEDLYEARKLYKSVKRIFLADGDAFVLPFEQLKDILNKIKELFPECERVTSYAAPNDILRKSKEEITALNKLGLKMLYMGIESGSDSILKDINKGVNSRDIIEAGKKAKDGGMKLSVTLISGIGGKDKWMENAVESARVINAIEPDYLGTLTFMVEPNTPMHQAVKSGKFQILNPDEAMLEMRELIKNIDVKNCIFRSNHASNYMPIGGNLSKDKEKLIKLIDDVLKGKYEYKPEGFRRL